MQMDNGVTRQVEVERQRVDAMYERLDLAVTEALAAHSRVLAAPAESAAELYARDVEVARLTRTVGELRAAERSLCFGRIDSAAGGSLHIGRIGLRSEDGAVLLVDWRADAARPFYAATPAWPMGLRRRRHLRLNHRRVADVSDEILDGSGPTSHDIVGDGPLVAALGRARTGRMREAVATLQAEQDVIVRSPHRGVTVVEGGPGTGKTIVALHRAAYVLYAFPVLAERGVLVFGPNRRFLDYISEVLPSLGENDVQMATLADLAGVAPSAADSDPVARIKGQARLAAALARWVRDRQPRGVPLAVRVGQDTLVLEPETVIDAHRVATSGGLAHNPAREAFKEHLVEALVNLLERRTTDALNEMDAEVAAILGVDLDQAVAGDLRRLGLDEAVAPAGPEFDWDSVRDGLIEDPAVDFAIEAVWPRLRAADALEQFLTDREALTTYLPSASVDEVAHLVRDPGSGLTDADLALLDEARALIEGPPAEVYGHIVVDEAQELSEMQWRMLMRRCPGRSMTIVGDFAQAGSATTVRTWPEAVGPFVGERFDRHTLTINYRTTAEILDSTAPLLARIAPGQVPSRSIRHGERPRTIPVTDADIPAALLELVEQTNHAHTGELVGVIGPTDRVADLTRVLDGTGAVIVAAPDARGLEFDTVVVVDPGAIEARRQSGTRDLYVALTRATKRVAVLRLGGGTGDRGAGSRS
ncbi:HelD family protein [Actinopolymorpha pittospori]|uniref:DNA helicase IV n=1 Tax=Actinopolymorpha pittospori TaxID=648752 RepID=A0A927MMA7_9ACTN|nr:ATP-binding domain-containing protein [Actinopolymorpha pittospori]MBE1603290.1 DNA helicase IV [Actinopolymorpha pittospori]